MIPPRRHARTIAACLAGLALTLALCASAVAAGTQNPPATSSTTAGTPTSATNGATPAGGAAAPAAGATATTPPATVPTIATTTPTTPATTPAPPASTTPAPGTATTPATGSAKGVVVVTRGGNGGGVSGGAILAAVIAALIALGCLVWAIFRFGALEPHWLLSARHSLAEAGFRASATWAEFTDWIRLGH